MYAWSFNFIVKNANNLATFIVTFILIYQLSIDYVQFAVLLHAHQRDSSLVPRPIFL